ncbi:MAG: hypothetical protein P4L40_07140 [Terracidiphilus sp.]|nr:hypothetical protein [Terracidiphilus sp.]
MRSCLFVGCLLFGWMRAIAAQSDIPHSPSPVVSTLVVRTGEPLQASHKLTYELVEFSQQRGRWVVPDIGIYGSRDESEKLLFAGGGAEFRFGNKIDFTQILYVSQAVGRGAHGARTLWIWPVLDVNLTPKWMAEAVIYPTIPLNRAAEAGFDIDRIKFQYAFNRRFSAGAGYSASIYESCSWKNKPLVTATIFARSNSYEFWVERIPAGAQVQVRTTLVRSGR